MLTQHFTGLKSCRAKSPALESWKVGDLPLSNCWRLTGMKPLAENVFVNESTPLTLQ